jgi:hypothetical protein
MLVKENEENCNRIEGNRENNGHNNDNDKMDTS